MLQTMTREDAPAFDLTECDVDELIETVGDGLRSLLTSTRVWDALSPEPAEAVLALMGCCVGRQGDWRGLARDLRSHMLLLRGEVGGRC